MKNKIEKVMVTGGLGFIGSHFVELLIAHGYQVMTFDNISYAADQSFLRSIEKSKLHNFVRGDVRDEIKIKHALEEFRPNYVVNFAAESHVDNSLREPKLFCDVNFMGAATLLDEIRKITPKVGSTNFVKFVQIGTDEVYGSRKVTKVADPQTLLSPSNVYSASKAAADLLALSYFKTYEIPVVVTRACNNYGPRQHAEKFIPTILKALKNNKTIPIYGAGDQMRQWIHVLDHAAAIFEIMLHGAPGTIFNVGDENYISNLELAKKICGLYDAIDNNPLGTSENLIRHVDDRLGHDFGYSISSDDTRSQLSWSPKISFEKGLSNLVATTFVTRST